MSPRFTFSPMDFLPSGKHVVLTSMDDILDLGEGNIQQLIRGHRKEEAQLRQTLADPESYDSEDKDELTLKLSQTRAKIRRLIRLAARAEKKPVLPRLRPMDYFAVNDEVVCYVGDWSSDWDEKLIDDDWVTGLVIGGPSFIGTRYKIFASHVVHSGSSGGGHTLDFFVVDPRLMHRWEFEYFLTHIDFATKWMAHAEIYARTPASMYDALQHKNHLSE